MDFVQATPAWLQVRGDGVLKLGSDSDAPGLSSDAEDLRLALSLPGLQIYQPGGDFGMLTPRYRVLMAGEIASRMMVMEVINMICNAGWHGELHVLQGETHRCLYLEQGALKQARSNDVQDRLGEVALGLGLLSRAQLDQLLTALSSDKRLGAQLLAHGLVDEQQLFRCLQQQAEHIFYNALIMGSGHYAFLLPGDDTDSEAPSTPLHIPVQGLLMEGVQRVDEMALFRERIPDSHAVVEQSNQRLDMKKLDDTTRTVLELCDGKRRLHDISLASGLGEFATTKAIYHLLGLGAVALRAAGPKFDPEAILRLVGAFNEVIQDVFIAVATFGRLEQARQTLTAWMQDSGYTPYFGPELGQDGTIDAERVVQSLAQSGHEAPIEALHQALHELVAFALFAASSSLPREQERELARDVSRRLRAIRI